MNPHFFRPRACPQVSGVNFPGSRVIEGSEAISEAPTLRGIDRGESLGRFDCLVTCHGPRILA